MSSFDQALPRPEALPVIFDNIPGELQYLNQWVMWGYKWKEGKDGKPGKWDKPPLQPNGKYASSTSKLTWSSFSAAKEAYEHGLSLPVDDPLHFDGIGFVPKTVPQTENNLQFGDLDKCRNKETGELSPEAKTDLDLINSYCEISPSGTGIRFIAKGAPPYPTGKDGGKAGGIELYQARHYLTITGHRLQDYPTAIEKRSGELEEFYQKHFLEPASPTPKQSQQANGLTDDQIICLASEAANAKKFLALMGGDINGYPSHSEADQALCNILAFYTISEGQIDSIFRRSGLYREKWERADYRDSTIQKALSLTVEHYSGPRGEEISEEELEGYSLPEGPKFECTLPKEHFIQRFMAYGSDISDAYVEYWFAGSLFALAVVADKKIKVSLKQGTIYPNLYISINGKSSLARKSTVVDKVEEMLCQVSPGLQFSRVPTEFSPEAFTEHLSDYNHAPWIRDEAAGVLSLMKRDYMRGFKDSLMQLYDSKPFYRKLRTSQRKSVKTEFRVDDPYLNLLWATTDASLGANTEQNDTLSGFMARFLFFFPQGKKSKWLPLEEGTAANSIFEGVVRDQLTSIAAKMAELPECTALHFSPEAASYYTEWQRAREEEWTASNDGNAMQIYSRLAPTVTKLALLFELGSPDFDVSNPIRPEFVEEACRLVDFYFMPTARAVYDLVGQNSDKNRLDKIAAHLKKHGGKAQKRDILRATRLTKKEFDEAIEAMLESGEIEQRIDNPQGKRGRPKIWILLRENNVINVIKVNKVINVNKVNRDKSSFLHECDNGDVIDINDRNDKNDKNPLEHHRKESDPGLSKFKTGMAKRTCCLCGRTFPYDLTPYFNNGQSGHICSNCHIYGSPSEPAKEEGSQSKLDLEGGEGASPA